MAVSEQAYAGKANQLAEQFAGISLAMRALQASDASLRLSCDSEVLGRSECALRCRSSRSRSSVPKATPKPDAPLIAGIIGGVVVLCCVIGIALVLLARRRNRNTPAENYF